MKRRREGRNSRLYTRLMQFPAKRWIHSQAAKSDESSGDLVSRLLTARGAVTTADRDAFCHPKLTQLQHPSDLHDAQKAAHAICDAVRSGKRIAIYGDYDVDGVMSSAIVWHMLRALDPQINPRVYVPHRIEEGYGLNAEALRLLRDEGIELIITVDCGVSAINEARIAHELGLTLIITDHHELNADGEIPMALAVVHPRLGTTQRYGELCGAGVAWKLAWMIAEAWCGVDRLDRDASEPRAKLPQALRDRVKTLLPLAAIGTVADVVPMLGENRVLVAYGLREVQCTGVDGLDALLSSLRLDSGPVDAEKVAFRLAPLINACGRMKHAEDAMELFTTATNQRARDLAKLLGELNAQRRLDDAAIFADALRMVKERHEDKKPRGIVLQSESWNLGIVGIVCSKLVDIYACPVILLTRNKDAFKGSGRSVEGIELHKVLDACGAHLLRHGGHAMAAGVTIAESSIEAFTEAFTREVDALLPPSDLQKCPLTVDAACTLSTLNLASVEQLNTLAPFGRDNRKPLFLVEHVEVTATRPIGRDGKHIEVTIKQIVGGKAHFLRMQWWSGAEHIELLAKGTRMDVVIEPTLNTFKGIAEVEARVVDIKFAAAVVSRA